ncbi:MAG: metal ABC transporter permease [Phycisphaerales bacterium]
MIPAWIQQFMLLDLFPLSAAVMAAVSCGLLGNFLVLRRQSLMGDAISHAVLPGLVAAFLITQSRRPEIMFIGAAVSALATVVLTELIKRLGRVEPGAAMGVVFSVLFALGVYLLENAAARSVDLDADCVLHGNLQTLFWAEPPTQWSGLFDSQTLGQIPRQVWTLVVTLVAVFAFVGLFFKELRIVSFDPGIATAQGIHAGGMHMALMTFVAIAAVASFEAVGSILVIAMLICPAATARLLTDRLASQLTVSVGVSVLTALIGYGAASVMGVNAAGMMASVSGVLLVAAIVASPSHGVIARSRNQRRIGRSVATEDVLGALYRLGEIGKTAARGQLVKMLGAPARTKTAIERAIGDGLITERAGRLELTDTGRAHGAAIIRRHRLWEGYLVDEAGLSPDHVHATAERLEHLDLSERLGRGGTPELDPQGKPIPPGDRPTL